MTKRTILTLSVAGLATLGSGAFAVANAATAPKTAASRQTREVHYEQALAKAVTAGKLTAAQETAILAEHSKLASELTAAPKATAAEREAIRKQVRTEAESWAKANDIKPRWLMTHPHLRGMQHLNRTASPSPTPAG